LDLLAVKKASTGSGKTELHVVNGADGFKTFLAHIATYLGVTGTDSSWAFAAGDYNRDGKKDLYAIKKNTTSQTEIHVLNGADGYQSMLTQVATVLQYTGSDSRWVFDL
ncbi:MAG TPA: hypothetical protein VF794_24980, partial [Archangium sp.]|uniref:hypothetical protein n=1 Tax=Archangium sp. TaxID=1872627 RepID=UPI002ED8A6D2